MKTNMKKTRNRKRKTLPEDLMEAAYNGDLKYLKKYLTEENINNSDATNRTLLFYSILDDLPDVAKLLVKKGAACDLKDKLGWTPLHYAAQDQNAAAVKILIRAGAEIDSKDDNGNTPLSRATYTSEGKGTVIKLLLRSGANPNRKNKHGVSPKKLADMIANYPVSQFFK
jgi:uncharacterized protein